MKSAGQKFRTEFLKSVELAGPEQDRLLDLAVDALDQIADIKARIDEDGLIVQGSQGQPVAHPLLKELRSARQEFARLVKDLAPPAEPGRSQAGAVLAKARWSR